MWKGYASLTRTATPVPHHAPETPVKKVARIGEGGFVEVEGRKREKFAVAKSIDVIVETSTTK
mgnify:CR=1 FL=1